MPELKFSEEQKSIFKAQFAPDASPEQFAYFIAECERRELVPGVHVHFRLQPTKEYNRQLQKEIWSNKVVLITGIGALRLIAQRSGSFEGYGTTHIYYSNGQGFDESKIPGVPEGRIPHAVTVSGYRKGWREAVLGVARWDAYCGKKNDGNLTKMWELRGEEQLTKCAEADMLRKIAPEEAGNIYIDEEFQQEEKAQQPSSQAVQAQAETPVKPPAPTVAPAVNQAAADTPKSVTPNSVPAPAAPKPAAPPAPPKQAPKPPAPPKPPTPPAAPKPAPTPGSVPNRVPQPETEPQESPEELAEVADRIARDKEHVSVAIPAAAQEVLANPAATPAEIAAAHAQAIVTPDPAHAAPVIVVQQPAPAVAAGDAPVTSEEFNKLMLRASKIVRDKLPAGNLKNGGEVMKAYLAKKSGKTNMKHISAVVFERLLSALESATPEEAVKIVTEGAK